MTTGWRLKIMRCYDGCWDSEARAKFKAEDDLMVKIRKIESEAHCTRHYNLDFFVVHIWGRPLSKEMPTKMLALSDAYERISI